MHKSYEFHEKNSTYVWGRDAASVISDHIGTDRDGWYHSSRGIEDQITAISQSFGGFADLLISKGVITPDEFLNAIGMHRHFEVKMIEPE